MLMFDTASYSYGRYLQEERADCLQAITELHNADMKTTQQFKLS
jgi:hypothetical protein